MRYAIAEFDEKMGQIDDSDLKWHEGTQTDAEEFVRSHKGTCALFYYGDVKRGVPLKPDATREEFEADPARLGICFFHCWQGFMYE